jgi:hypothetical protein
VVVVERRERKIIVIQGEERAETLLQFELTHIVN